MTETYFTRTENEGVVILYRAVLFLLIFIQFNNIHIYANSIKFTGIGKSDGLSSEIVYSIVQDDYGVIWFGTPDGMNRYDGYDIEVFANEPGNPNSLPVNNAGNIFKDRDGKIWVGTWGGGLSIFDPETYNFENYHHVPDDSISLKSNKIQTLHEDRNGGIWIGTFEGLNKFDREKGEFTRFNLKWDKDINIGNLRIWSIADDSDGIVWLGTDIGLVRFDHLKNELKLYQLPVSNSSSKYRNLVREVYCSGKGVLWIGGQFGLFRFDPVNERLVPFKSSVNEGPVPDRESITCLYEDKDILWIGTLRSGLFKYELKTGRVTNFKHDLNDPNSISENDIRAIMKDRSGMMWVATHSGGVNKFDASPKKFLSLINDPENKNSIKDNNIWAILEDRDGDLWFGTKYTGISRWDRKKNRFRHYVDLNINPYIKCFYEDKSGNIWIGTEVGLHRLEKSTGKHNAFIRDPSNENSLSSNDVFAVTGDREGFIWVGTYRNGLNRYDPATGIFHRYKHDENDEYSLSDNSIRRIFMSRNGEIWIGTENGLNKYVRGKDKFLRLDDILGKKQENFSVSVNDIYEDERMNLYIATYSGLITVNNSTGATALYTAKDGLASNVVYGIMEDDSLNLWLSTSGGISRFNPADRIFKNYYTEDGLRNEGYSFNSFCRSESGEMFFGGSNGVDYFHPDSIRDNLFEVPVIPAKFKVLNEDYELKKPLHETESINLNYKQNFISFEFAALDYKNPGRNLYAYQLEGIDENWVQSGNRRFANYTDLEPGRYIFRVKATNSDGIWNEEGFRIKITIVPPYWKTAWFQILLLFLAGGVILSIHKLRMLSVKRKKKELEQIVEKKTQELRLKNEELEKSLKEVKALSGLLPLCSHCKKVRDDDGYWEQVDVYIQAHSDVEVSHSLCPDCAKKIYPDLNLRNQVNKTEN